MAFGFVPIIHIVALVFSIIELGLSGYDANEYHWFFWGSPSWINFMVFNSVWSILVLLYVGVTPLYMTSIFHRLAALVLNAITTLFWFAGSIAWAVRLGGPWKCGADTVCGTQEGGIAFGFFLWAIFLFLTVLDAIESLGSRRSGTAAPGPKPHAYPGA